MGGRLAASAMFVSTVVFLGLSVSPGTRFLMLAAVYVTLMWRTDD